VNWRISWIIAWNICYFYFIIHSLQHSKPCSSKNRFEYKAWEYTKDARFFAAWFHFGTYLPAASSEVYWKHIWITTEQNSFLLPCICSLINEHKKLTKYYTPQWRLWNASRMALLCFIPCEGCIWWGWWHCKKTCSNHIMAPHQLCVWVQSSIHNLSFDFMTEN
jgi:hypothetical protein